MSRKKTQVVLISLCWLLVLTGSASAGNSDQRLAGNAESTMESSKDLREQYTLLPTHRVIRGVVEAISADHATVNSGDTGEITPRYLSLERAREKGFTLKVGNEVIIIVNAKNHVVDYHLKNEENHSHHKILKGKLAQPLKVGQELAIIMTEDGTQKTFPVRPLARSEVAAIPFDTAGLFLIDETNKIASATLTKDVVAEADWARSSAMNVYRHVDGIIQKQPAEHTVVLKTKDSETISLPVWNYLTDELQKLSKGMHVTLLVDREDKVVDIAYLPSEVE
ncbi:MAG: hypothetical protein WD425_11905 [Nitrospirales bacterium]